jgi:hypothetical protein
MKWEDLKPQQLQALKEQIDRQHLLLSLLNRLEEMRFRKILPGTKTWEIRSKINSRAGRIALCENGGPIVASAAAQNAGGDIRISSLPAEGPNGGCAGRLRNPSGQGLPISTNKHGFGVINHHK